MPVKSTVIPYRKDKKMISKRRVACIFVHAGAGYHSIANEPLHLAAVNDAAKTAMALLNAGGSAVDAVELAIKVLEDREIANAGYGSNLSINGTVECDAVILDHLGHSGAVGAVEQIKNPISLARLVLDRSTQPLSLRRLPPNFLSGHGAREFAYEHGMPILPHDYLISPVSKARWQSWLHDLRREEEAKPEVMRLVGPLPPRSHHSAQREALSSRYRHMLAMLDSVCNEAQPISLPAMAYEDFDTSYVASPQHLDQGTFDLSDVEDSTDNPLLDSMKPGTSEHLESRSYQLSAVSGEVLDQPIKIDMDEFIDADTMEALEMDSREDAGPRSPTRMSLDGSQPMAAGDPRVANPSFLSNEPGERAVYNHLHGDLITDTVGAIAFDLQGHLACGASSGGVAMKHSGRVGPAALVGAGAAMIPPSPSEEDETAIATVTSGTGEHISRTMAASVCSERVLEGRRRLPTGFYEECSDEEAIRGFVENEFLTHPSVSGSPAVPSIGLLAVKRTKNGVYFHFAHTTESFAITSLRSDRTRPVHAMSRKAPGASIAQGGLAVRTQ